MMLYAVQRDPLVGVPVKPYVVQQDPLVRVSMELYAAQRDSLSRVPVSCMLFSRSPSFPPTPLPDPLVYHGPPYSSTSTPKPKDCHSNCLKGRNRGEVGGWEGLMSELTLN